MNKIKVLHIIPDLGIGGAEKLVLDICKFIDKDIFEVKVICLFASQGTIYEQIAKENNIEIVFLNKKIGFDYKIIGKLRKIFRKEKVDIINTHLYVMSYVLPAAISSMKFNIVHTVHNIADKELRKPVRCIMNIGYKFVGVVPIGISHYITQTISKEYDIEVSKIPCIYNGIDTTLFKEETKEKNNSITFINVGRFTKQKNHRLLISAFQTALKQNLNIRLKLVGDGELKKEIEKYVDELGISKYVEFMGIKKDVKKELINSDVFIMTSDWEGLPLSVLEAMACGLPVITTKAGGVIDIVEPDHNGFIVEQGDEEGLVKAIIKLAKDDKLLQKMSLNSKNLIKQYDIRNQVKKYENLYQRKYGNKI